MKQIAGMQFLEWYNEYIKEYGCSPSEYDVNYFWKDNYLPMEKQQIIEAFENGEDNIDADGCHINMNGAEQYYNDTFKK
jgi:hypothetical protein